MKNNQISKEVSLAKIEAKANWQQFVRIVGIPVVWVYNIITVAVYMLGQKSAESLGFHIQFTSFYQK